MRPLILVIFKGNIKNYNAVDDYYFLNYFVTSNIVSGTIKCFLKGILGFYVDYQTLKVHNLIIFCNAYRMTSHKKCVA